MTNADAAAHAALRQRQGAGARFDAPAAPHDDLLRARRGTAFFARKLSQLTDAELSAPSARAGRSRAWVVANVSFAARREALRLEARLGHTPKDVPPDLEQHFLDLDLAETLPPQAIRHLFRHSEVHLNVCWRDLTDDQWGQPLANSDDPPSTLRSLPRQRAVHIWRAALDLNNGAHLRDLPAELRVACPGGAA